MFMTWLNTVCAVYLGVGILGVKHPHLFIARAPAVEEPLSVVEIPPEPKPDSLPKALEVPPPDQPFTEEKSENLPVVVPISVIPLKDAAFARPVEGLVTYDPHTTGTYDRTQPNVGVAGPEPKAGNPQAAPKVVGKGGRRRFTDDDVDRGSAPLPRPNVAKYGRVDVEPGAVIRITFGADGAVTDVAIFPPLSNPTFEKELRVHVRKNWHSKIGAISGDWPLNQQD